MGLPANDAEGACGSSGGNEFCCEVGGGVLLALKSISGGSWTLLGRRDRSNGSKAFSWLFPLRKPSFDNSTRRRLG